jgi:molecular chaperone DnaJ
VPEIERMTGSHVAAGTKDYYAILGVEKNATDEEIKRAFRRKARETHPDVSDHEDAEERFKEINEAYDVLSDASKRQMYDQYGSIDGRFGGGPDLGDFFGGFGMEDIFSAFFNGVSGVGRRVRLEGRDMVAHLSITLEEAATGVDQDLVVDRLAPCDACGATGMAADANIVTCPECGGTGQQVTHRRTFLGVMQSVHPCQRCGQTGSVIDRPCEECEGSGRVPDRQHVTVKVPAGIMDGMQLRLQGVGEAGVRGAASGDLIVNVHVKEHEFLHREGDDLHARVTVSVPQAALGAELTTPGLLEPVKVTVPAGSQFGDVVKVKGQGMPRLRGSNRGDLLVHLAVEVPRKLTKRQRELLEELESETSGRRKQPTTPLQKLKDWLTG